MIQRYLQFSSTKGQFTLGLKYAWKKDEYVCIRLRHNGSSLSYAEGDKWLLSFPNLYKIHQFPDILVHRCTCKNRHC